jgi:hypothetical protein
LLEGREKLRAVREATPKAWHQLLAEPDEMRLEILSDRVEKLCGHRPESQVLAEFLSTTVSGQAVTGQSSWTIDPFGSSPIGNDTASEATGERGIYTHTRPGGVAFAGQRRQVSTYKEIPLGVCDILRSMHAHESERVLSLRGRKRSYFSRDARAMRSPQKISGTNICVETNLSANSIVERCHDLLSLFKHDLVELKIEHQVR